MPAPRSTSVLCARRKPATRRSLSLRASAHSLAGSCRRSCRTLSRARSRSVLRLEPASRGGAPPMRRCTPSRLCLALARKSSSCASIRRACAASVSSARFLLSPARPRWSPSRSPIFFMASARARLSCGKRSWVKSSAFLSSAWESAAKVLPNSASASASERASPFSRSESSRAACSMAFLGSGMFIQSVATSLRALTSPILRANSAMRARSSRISRSIWRRNDSSPAAW